MVVERSERTVATNSDDCGTGRSSSVTVRTSIGGTAGSAPSAALPGSNRHTRRQSSEQEQR